jgi:hypothetical protein
MSAWVTPTTPNLPDYILFVQQNMGIDPLYLPSVAAPAAPALTPGTGGSLASGTIWVKITYVSALGETNPSPEGYVVVAGPSASVSVASPGAVTGATGYNVYASTATGQETLQNGTPVAIGTAYVIHALAAGVALPLVNTAGSPFLGYALDQAMALVIRAPSPGIDYTLATYNCAGHIQIRITPDQTGRGFFQEQRATFDMLKQSVGLVQATNNVDTGSTFAVPDALKQLTIGDLGFMKTPWGREYLAYAQDFGGVWGLT